VENNKYILKGAFKTFEVRNPNGSRIYPYDAEAELLNHNQPNISNEEKLWRIKIKYNRLLSRMYEKHCGLKAVVHTDDRTGILSVKYVSI